MRGSSGRALLTASEGNHFARSWRGLTLAFFALSLAGFATPSWSSDIEAGRAKSAQCAVCHGVNGMATAPDAPNLAGQNEMYLVKALKDYQSKARQHEVMNIMATGLSDDDIANLAAYYQSKEVELKTP